MQALLRRHLRHDLTLTQAWVLHLLDDHGAGALSEIAERLDLSLSAASNVVDQLIRTGWVVRRRHARDRRVVEVSMTQAGREMVTEAKIRRRAILQVALSRLNAKDVENLQHILHKLDWALSWPDIDGELNEEAFEDGDRTSSSAND